jgi:hypothetical protein
MNQITPIAGPAHTKSSSSHKGTTTLGKSLTNNEKFLDIIKLVSRFLSLQDVCTIKQCAQIPAWKFFGESSPGLKLFQPVVARLYPSQQEIAWRCVALKFEKEVPSLEPLPSLKPLVCSRGTWGTLACPLMVQLQDGRIVKGTRKQLWLLPEDGSFIKNLKEMDARIFRIKLLADGRISVEDENHKVHKILSLKEEAPTIIPCYNHPTNKMTFQNALLPPMGGFVALRLTSNIEVVWLKPCGTFGSVCLELIDLYGSMRIRLRPLLDGGFAVQTKEPNKLYVCQPSVEDRSWKVQDVSNVLDLDPSEWERSTEWNLLCKPLSDGRLVISTSTGHRRFWNPKTGECSKNFGACLPENEKDSDGKFSSLSDGRIVETVSGRPRWLWSSSGDLLGFFKNMKSLPRNHFYFKTPKVFPDHSIFFTCSTGERFIVQPNFPDQNIRWRTPSK